MPSREFLKRRNALWQQLRALSSDDGVPDSPEFEAALLELSRLTSWERERVLAGLGLSEAPTPEDRP